MSKRKKQKATNYDERFYNKNFNIIIKLDKFLVYKNRKKIIILNEAEQTRLINKYT